MPTITMAELDQFIADVETWKEELVTYKNAQTSDVIDIGSNPIPPPPPPPGV